MIGRLGFRVIAGCAVCLPCLLAAEPEGKEKEKEPAPAKKAVAILVQPPYRIILRSRSGEVVPGRNKNAQTGSGYIDVVQRDPATVMVIMRGAVVAGSETHRGGEAAMHFVLDQTFDIMPTQEGLRPPVLKVTSMLTGVLDSTRPKGGSATQGPACFVILSGEQPLVSACIKPHSVGCSQDLFVSEREGPFEVPVVPGGYCLHETFDLAASTPPIDCLCPHVVPAAGAVFSVDPRLDSRWNYVFAPFRAVPHQNFGFGVLLRVTEAPPLPAELIPPPLPTPRKVQTTQLPSNESDTVE